MSLISLDILTYSGLRCTLLSRAALWLYWIGTLIFQVVSSASFCPFFGAVSWITQAIFIDSMNNQLIDYIA